MASPNEVNIIRRELKKVVDRIAKDPKYRQQLIENPREVLSAVVELDPWGDSLGYLGMSLAAPIKCKGKTTCKITCLKTCGPVVKTCGGSNKK